MLFSYIKITAYFLQESKVIFGLDVWAHTHACACTCTTVWFQMYLSTCVQGSQRKTWGCVWSQNRLAGQWCSRTYWPVSTSPVLGLEAHTTVLKVFVLLCLLFMGSGIKLSSSCWHGKHFIGWVISTVSIIFKIPDSPEMQLSCTNFSSDWQKGLDWGNLIFWN